MKTLPAIRVQLHRSAWRNRAAYAVAAATALLVLATELPRWVIVAGIGWCAGALAFDRRRERKRAPAVLVVRTDRQITVIDADGAAQSGIVLDGTYVTAFLTTIVWRPVGARRPRCIAVLPDSMAAEDRCRLRVWLRFSHPPDAMPAVDATPP